MLPVLDLIYLLGQKNSSSLAICFRFHYKSFVFSDKLLSELTVLRWKQPSFWEEVIMIWSSSVHIHEAEAKQIFS